MRFRILPIAALAVGLLAGSFAHAGTDYSTWGIKVGLFMPSGNEIRSIFGNNWISFGVTPKQSVASDKWQVGFDIGAIYATSGGNHLLLVPATVGLSKRFAPANDPVIPYVAARTGVAYYDYSITPVVTTYSATKFDATANIEAGLIFSQKLMISARYDWFAHSDGFNFDGFTVWAQLLLFKF